MSKVANTCVYCDSNFLSKTELKKHIEVNVVTCKWCECEFIGEKKYILHIKNCANETLDKKNAIIKDNLIKIAKLTLSTEVFMKGMHECGVARGMLFGNIRKLEDKISVIERTPDFFRKFCEELIYRHDESLKKVFDESESCDRKIKGWFCLDETVTFPILVKTIALGGNIGKATHRLANQLVNSEPWSVDDGFSYINHILNELIPLLEQFCEECEYSIEDHTAKKEDHEFMKEVDVYYDAIFEENSRGRKDLVEQVKNDIFMENYKFLAEKDRAKNNK